eukprot:scaffold250430_cov21-Tisochrysis_lutea.AAC.3
MQGRQPPVCGCPRHVTPMPGAGFAQPQSATKRGHGPSAWQSGVPRRQQPQIRTAAPTCGLPRPVQGNCKGGLTDGLQVGELPYKSRRFVQPLQLAACHALYKGIAKKPGHQVLHVGWQTAV